MDNDPYAPYYRSAKHNALLVHFVNSDDLSDQEVIEVFSQFGAVRYVQPAIKPGGLCYVGLGSMEAVKRCVDAFRTHHYFRLIKHSSRGVSNTPLFGVRMTFKRCE